jgi:hypothetical protein
MSSSEARIFRSHALQRVLYRSRMQLSHAENCRLQTLTLATVMPIR